MAGQYFQIRNRPPHSLTAMKLSHLTLAVLVTIISGFAQSHQVQNTDLQDMTADQLQTWIATTNGGQDSADIVEAVFVSGRQELIAKCYEFPVTAGRMLERVVDLPNSPHKDAIVVSILRSSSPYFPRKYNPNVGDVRKGSIAPWPIEPFSSVIKKWLPDEPLNESIMNTPEARAVLATKLEAAIAGLSAPESNPPATPRPEQPGKQNEAVASGSLKIPSAPAPTSAPLQSHEDHRWWWVLALVSTLSVFLLIRWCRMTGSRSGSNSPPSNSGSQ